MNQVVRPITSYRVRSHTKAGLRHAASKPDEQPEKRFEIGPIIYEEANRRCPTCGSHYWIYSGDIATCYPEGHGMPRFEKKEIQKDDEDAMLPPSGADSAA